MRILNSVCLLLITMTGCSTQPFIPDTGLNPANSATIIIYTPDTAFNQQNFIKPAIFVDGKKLGKVSVNQPLSIQLPEGLHTIGFQRSFMFMPLYEAGSLDIKTYNGEIYHIRYSYDFDDHARADNAAGSTGASSFRLIDNTRGEKQE